MMANCFFCGKKIGMFDGCSYIEKMPTCSSCDSMIREDVNNVLATCRTKDDIIKTKELILKKLGGSLPFVDSASTVFAVTAQILCVKRCTEQWIMWILVNILNISIWYINFSSGGDNIATLLMWSVYLINAIFMFIKWYREANLQK